ncbi:Transcriptional regulator [Streptococcus sp. DD10]|uniref:helix-turn-helix domain-containing protein n=1 Tax=Streptococcus sp. DD10 TaxID=1777878 RepID=UPI0007942C10|nr:helix-turn-helix domain-containing protein [Streptococcus sp. DD10]KXT74736.1 Transcriptional regulator [Streptococcus sp. DD10]
MGELDFGQRLKELRKKKGLTKEELCGDEDELCVRQLTRWETGKAKPGLDKLTILASKLGMTVSDLIGETAPPLPEDYLKLKYQLIRTTSYGDKDVLSELDEAVDAIFARYFDDLPEEEQFIIEVLQSKLYTYEMEGERFGKPILEENLSKLRDKKQYTINDLLIVDLYQTHLDDEDLLSKSFDIDCFNAIVRTTLDSIEGLGREYLFKARDVLLYVPYAEFIRKDFRYSKEVLECLNTIMTMTQDYQQKPLVKMMEWQYLLGYKQDVDGAKECYQEAVSLAKLFGNEFLAEKLTEEWEKDLKK